MIYHWTLNDVLQMPARDFFHMLKYGRENASHQRYNFLHDLTYVAMMPKLTDESARNVRNMFLEFQTTTEEREANQEFVRQMKVKADAQRVTSGHVLDAGGPEAKAAVLNIFAMKKRMDHGR